MASLNRERRWRRYQTTALRHAPTTRGQPRSGGRATGAPSYTAQGGGVSRRCTADCAAEALGSGVKYRNTELVACTHAQCDVTPFYTYLFDSRVSLFLPFLRSLSSSIGNQPNVTDLCLKQPELSASWLPHETNSSPSVATSRFSPSQKPLPSLSPATSDPAEALSFTGMLQGGVLSVHSTSALRPVAARHVQARHCSQSSGATRSHRGCVTRGSGRHRGPGLRH